MFKIYSISQVQSYLPFLKTTLLLINLWSWSYCIWIYNYLCYQCLSPLTLWVRTPLRRGELDTTLCDKICQWLATGRWFSLCSPLSSTNKTDRDDIPEILLKVVLNTINQTIPNHLFSLIFLFINLSYMCSLHFGSSYRNQFLSHPELVSHIMFIIF